MRSRFLRVILASSIAVGSFAACTTTGNAPAPPGPSTPGTGVTQPMNPNPYPPPVVTAAPAPVTTPQAMASAAAAPVGPSSNPVPPPGEGAAMAPPPASSVPGQAPAMASSLSSSPSPSMSMSMSGTARPYQDVLKLKQAGLSDDFILNKIRTENVNYSLTTSEIVELRSAGLTETVLEAMLRSGQTQSAMAGNTVARKAEFPGLSRVTRGFMGIGAKTKNVGRLVVDGDTITFTGAEDPDQNFSVFAKNVKEIFNTCVRKPGSNLCLEAGFVTYTGEEYKFRDPGWKNGDNRLVTDVTNYMRRAFPNLFFSERAVNEL